MSFNGIILLQKSFKQIFANASMKSNKRMFCNLNKSSVAAIGESVLQAHIIRYTVASDDEMVNDAVAFPGHNCLAVDKNDALEISFDAGHFFNNRDLLSHTIVRVSWAECRSISPLGKISKSVMDRTVGDFALLAGDCAEVYSSGDGCVDKELEQVSALVSLCAKPVVLKANWAVCVKVCFYRFCHERKNKQVFLSITHNHKIKQIFS